MNLFAFLSLSNAFYFFTNKPTDNTKEFDRFLEGDSSEEQSNSEDPTPLERDEPVSDEKELLDDLEAIKIEDPSTISPSEDVQAKVETLGDIATRFNEVHGLKKGVSSLTDKNMWKRLHAYIKLNLGDFLINGNLSIQLEIRYILCCYVIAFIPGQFAFVVPGFYTYLIPKKAHTIPIVSDGLKGLKAFFRFAKDKSRESLFITFYFGRANSISEDIDFILRIPDLLVHDPVSLLREFLKFKIKAEGYDSLKYYK